MTKFDLSPRDLFADILHSAQSAAAWGGAVFVLCMLRALQIGFQTAWQSPTGLDEHGRTALIHVADLSKIALAIGLLITAVVFLGRLVYDIWFYAAHKRMRRKRGYYM